jgi:hypothetical protein
MQRSTGGVLTRVCLLAIGLVVVGSCASTGGFSGVDDTVPLLDPSRKTQQQVQAELMGFADRHFAVTLEAARTLEGLLETPEGRHNAAASRMLSLVVTTDIAASPNPGAAVLDMTAYVTLRRMVFEDYWMPHVYGEDGRVVLDALRELEQDIWEIAAGVYPPDQLAAFADVIREWKEAHPDVVMVDFVRLKELGESKQAQEMRAAARPGGLLAPISEANRNLEETRLLVERLAFMVTRMQLLLNLQFEVATAKLATQPDVRQLVEDSRTFAEVSDRAAQTFAELVADLPEERSAAIDQILQGLSEERERLLADLASDDGDLRPLIADVRDTLEIGNEVSLMVREAIRDYDALLTHFDQRDAMAERPFDILEWQQTIAEAAVTAREAQKALASLENLLASAEIQQQLDDLVATAERLENEVVDDIIDRAFLLGVLLIVVFFIALTVHRWIVREWTPSRAPKRSRDE